MSLPAFFPIDESMEGKEIYTNSPKVLESRKTTVELILSDHNKNCLSCVRNLNCELQTLSNELGCNAANYTGAMNSYKPDVSTAYLVARQQQVRALPPLRRRL